MNPRSLTRTPAFSAPISLRSDAGRRRPHAVERVRRRRLAALERGDQPVGRSLHVRHVGLQVNESRTASRSACAAGWSSTLTASPTLTWMSMIATSLKSPTSGTSWSRRSFACHLYHWTQCGRIKFHGTSIRRPPISHFQRASRSMHQRRLWTGGFLSKNACHKQIAFKTPEWQIMETVRQKMFSRTQQ